MNSNQLISSLSYEEFAAKMRSVFDHSDHGGNASKRLFSIHQGAKSAAEYPGVFQTVAADVGWNNKALQGAFVNSLNQLKDELASCERRRERSGPLPLPRSSSAPARSGGPQPPVSPVPTLAISSVEEPMQLGRTQLSPAEHVRRMRVGECLYCGQPSHFIASCPIRAKE